MKHSIEKIRHCSHLLPDPGGEVVRELCDEIAKLRRAFSDEGIAQQSLRARIERAIEASDNDGGSASDAIQDMLWILRGDDKEEANGSSGS